jgi:hypothetical protein
MIALSDGLWGGVARSAAWGVLRVAVRVEHGKVAAHGFDGAPAPFTAENSVERESDLLALFPSDAARVTVEQINAAAVLYRRHDRKHGDVAAILTRHAGSPRPASARRKA